jgi:hypothetical protein
MNREYLEGGKTNVVDAWTTHPSAVTYIKELIHQHIWDNQKFSPDESASEISITYERKQYKNGLRHNQNHLFFIESDDLWNTGLNALKSTLSNH